MLLKQLKLSVDVYKIEMSLFKHVLPNFKLNVWVSPDLQITKLMLALIKLHSRHLRVRERESSCELV